MRKGSWREAVLTVALLHLGIIVVTIIWFIALIPVAERMIPDVNEVNDVNVMSVQQSAEK